MNHETDARGIENHQKDQTRTNMMTRLEKLNQMLEREPQDAFLNFGVAMELVKAEDYAGAIARFDRLLSIDPDYTAGYHHKALAQLALDRIAEAQATLEAGVEAARRVDNAHALAEMSELLARVRATPR